MVTYVKKDDVVKIKNGQTAIISSLLSDEIMLVRNNPLKPLGAETHMLERLDNIDQIKGLRKRAGFSLDFVFLHTDITGEVSLTMECANSLPVVLCVQEVEENGKTHLKKCNAIIRDYEGKDNEQAQEQEMEF